MQKLLSLKLLKFMIKCNTELPGRLRQKGKQEKSIQEMTSYMQF